MSMHAEVVDLFCGVGGLSAGFCGEGFRVMAGIDLDVSCRYAYETNIGAKFLAKDASEIKAEDLYKFWTPGSYKVLIGCAPCQPFSIYTGRYRRGAADGIIDQRWQLLREFGRLIREVQPDVVSMENVPRVVLHPVFEWFVRELSNAGYAVTYHKIRADYYGVPQKRARLVLFASLHGPVSLVRPKYRSRPRTVRDAIGHLPPIEAGTAHAEDPLHVARNVGSKNLQRLMATSEGGGWADWGDELKLDCHRKTGGASFRAVYGRMTWDEPAPVITTQCLGIGNGRFGHPEQDRAISIREAALLQSFPKNFEFVPPGAKVNGKQLARQIGNAVPVRLAEAVARSIKRHLISAERAF